LIILRARLAGLAREGLPPPSSRLGSAPQESDEHHLPIVGTLASVQPPPVFSSPPARIPPWPTSRRWPWKAVIKGRPLSARLHRPTPQSFREQCANFVPWHNIPVSGN